MNNTAKMSSIKKYPIHRQRYHCFIWQMLILLCVSMILGPLYAETIVIQDGDKGRTADTTIAADIPGYNYNADYNYGGGQTGVLGGSKIALLFRFDLSEISDAIAVKSATFEITTTTNLAQPGANCELFQVLKDWEEGTVTGKGVEQPGSVTWKSRRHEDPGQEWSAPGLEKEKDHAAKTMGTVTIAGADVYKINLDPLVVLQWLQKPAANHGFVLKWKGGSAAGIFIVMSEYPPGKMETDATKRPKLTLEIERNQKAMNKF